MFLYSGFAPFFVSFLSLFFVRLILVDFVVGLFYFSLISKEISGFVL